MICEKKTFLPSSEDVTCSDIAPSRFGSETCEKKALEGICDKKFMLNFIHEGYCNKSCNHCAKKSPLSYFNEIASTTVNISKIGPSWRDNVSVIVSCMNREPHIVLRVLKHAKALNPQEIILIDYSSTIPYFSTRIKQILSKNLKLIKVEGQEHWNLGIANNIGIRRAKSEMILKIDCDTYLTPLFFYLNQDFDPSKEFLTGNYKDLGQASHLNGLILASKTAWYSVGGYEERYRTYGWDDEDLYARLKKMGFKRKHFVRNSLYHIKHELSKSDINNANGISTSFSRLLGIRRNAFLSQCSPWLNTTKHSNFNEYSKYGSYIRGNLSYVAESFESATPKCTKYANSASLREVLGWYLNFDPDWRRELYQPKSPLGVSLDQFLSGIPSSEGVNSFKKCLNAWPPDVSKCTSFAERVHPSEMFLAGVENHIDVLLFNLFSKPSEHLTEIIEAIKINAHSKSFNEIHILYEINNKESSCSGLVKTLSKYKYSDVTGKVPKIKCTEFKKQPSYFDMFDYASKMLAGRVVALANPDMVFSEEDVLHTDWERRVDNDTIFAVSSVNAPPHLLRQINGEGYDAQSCLDTMVDLCPNQCKQYTTKQEKQHMLWNDEGFCVWNEGYCRHVSWDAMIFRPLRSHGNVKGMKYPMNCNACENMAFYTMALHEDYKNQYNACSFLRMYNIHCAKKMHSLDKDDFFTTRDKYAKKDDASFDWTKWKEIPPPPIQYDAKFGRFCYG